MPVIDNIRVLRFDAFAQAIIPRPRDIERGLVPKLATQFRKIVRRNFAVQASRGSVWQELKSPYREQKRRRWGNKKILQASGDMREGLVSERHPDNVIVYERGELIMGTTNPIAGYHATGAGTLPVRNPIAHSARQDLSYATITHAWVRQRTNRLVRVLRASGGLGSRLPR